MARKTRPGFGPVFFYAPGRTTIRIEFVRDANLCGLATASPCVTNMAGEGPGGRRRAANAKTPQFRHIA
jgi:hypothetical protein